jgi:hypothetical protein
MPPLVPETVPSSAVTVCVVPGVALVVNVTVAIPFASVGVDPAENVPPFVLLQPTLRPELVTGLPFASASCAEMVTSVPAPGIAALEVTRYRAGAPALTSLVDGLPPIGVPLSVIATLSVPATVGV